MPELKEQETRFRAVVPATTDAPRRKVVVLNDPVGWPSEWEFERAPSRNDIITHEDRGLLYKVLGATSCGDLLLESFAGRPELERALGWTNAPIKAWLRW